MASAIFGVVFLAIVTYMVVVGIQLAAKLQWVLLTIEYLIVLGFSILGFFHGGGSPLSLDWFNPFSLGLGGLAAGVVISVFFYWGWDTAATVNEETEDATENPGRAGIIGMFALLVLFLVACTSIQMVLTPKELQDNASTTLTAFADKLVGNQWGSLAILAFLSSTIATLQTTLLPSARTAYSMGRDGMLGKIWAKIDPRWNTPAIGTIIMGAISGVMALASLGLGSSLGAVVTAGVTSIGLLVAFYYGPGRHRLRRLLPPRLGREREGPDLRGRRPRCQRADPLRPGRLPDLPGLDQHRHLRLRRHQRQVQRPGAGGDPAGRDPGAHLRRPGPPSRLHEHAGRVGERRRAQPGGGESRVTANLAGGAQPRRQGPHPGEQRSWWLREALAAEGEARDRPPLSGDINADVVIVGGGYTGLWTAYFLTERRPDLKVVVLEQDICGGGPSGRNGGFASGWWDELDGLITLYGVEGAVRACRAISASIKAIGEFCEKHAVDAWYRRAGYLFAATAPQHEVVCREMVRLAREVGAPEEMRELTADEVRQRCASPAFRTGAFMADGASVQPARLARGLRRVVLERGVSIYEGTVVTRLDPGPPAVAITPGGSVRAPKAVLAVNAWATGWPQLSRLLVAWSSYIVLTAPAPERLAALNWTGASW